jgi:hypothetical protein
MVVLSQLSTRLLSWSSFSTALLNQVFTARHLLPGLLLAGLHFE